jgi:hypothetical protein
MMEQLIIVGATLAAYGRALRGPWFYQHDWDDNLNYVLNDRIKELSFENLRWMCREGFILGESVAVLSVRIGALSQEWLRSWYGGSSRLLTIDRGQTDLLTCECYEGK